MSSAAQSSLRGALTLLVFALICTALMSVTWLLTRARVADNEQAARLALLGEALPGIHYDNDPVADAIILPVDVAAQLGQATAQAYPAQRLGVTQAVVIEATAPDGYAGAIRLLVGVGRDGRVLALRVIAHKETPGLGDYIEATKSAWSAQFTGASLASPPESQWALTKDGGRFDYMAGATITPRAVVRAVKATLAVVAARRAMLFGEEVKR
ncbi:MAG TPA: electron transport complex subunit RsxG [Chitinolyticbacter sp.]|nr:electron transport complex subunit RsxG [Chitinolyticbacter sp.]